MEESYVIHMGKHQVGKVQVIRQGLYYRFICRCKLSNSMMCKLYVICEGKRESLGVLIPMDGGFGIDTRIPVKRLGKGKMEFCLMPKHAFDGTFVPIYPEEPFSYLEDLKDGFLAIQNGQMGFSLVK